MDTLAAKHFSFADFELDTSRRLLLKQGKPVALNSKTFDLLQALVERSGEVLSKDELLEKVWAGQFVEEGNLTVHISALRKVLGEKKKDHHFIVTVPGRGYSFVAELKGDDDIVVESHRLSRILVKEEISENETDDQERPLEVATIGARPPRFDLVKQNRLAVAGSVLVIAVLSVGGYFFLRSRTSKSSVPFQQMSIKRLTSNGNVGIATLSPDGKLFAYSVYKGDEESLWLGHVDGGEPIQIRPPTRPRLVYLSLKFTPDGSSIYYTVSENFGNGTLYKIPVFGGAPEKIHENFRGLTFSPDGRRFAFLRYDNERDESILFTADADGSNEREIAVPPREISSDWHSSTWSPDGLTIALAASVKVDDTEAFVMNVSDGSVKSLATHAWRSIRAMTWLHDGSGLIAVAVEKNSMLPQLWYISFPGGEAHRLTTDLSLYSFITSSATDDSLLTVAGLNQSNIWLAPAENLSEIKQITFGSPGQNAGWYGVVWTLDGRVVYSAESNDGTTIWIMNADGRNQKQIVPNGGVNSYPSITDDGRYMVFQSNRSGHFAVWRSDLEGGNMVQLTGDQIAGQPYVSPDGKWVVYVSNADGPGELWRISTDGGEPLRLTEKAANWAQISPDSRFVACELETDGKTKLAVFSIDGGEPLKLFDIPRLANLRLGVHWMPDGKAVSYRDWADGIWKQSLDGGEPQKLEGLPKEKLYAYGWSHDGRQFAFTRGSEIRDVVLIRDAK